MTTIYELIDELLKEINQVLEDTKAAYQTGKKLEQSYIDAGIKIGEYSGGYKDGATNCIIKEHTDVWKISKLAEQIKQALPQEKAKWQAEPREVYVITDGHGHYDDLVFGTEQEAEAHCIEYNKKVKFPTMGGSHGYQKAIIHGENKK